MINQSLSFPFYKMGGSSCLVSTKQMLQPGKKAQWAPTMCEGCLWFQQRNPTLEA